MVFVDFLDLKFAVADLVGNRDISDVLPRLTRMAESRLNRELRTREQITDATLTFVDGKAPIPADFAQLVSDDYRVDGASLIYCRPFSGDRAVQYYATLPTIAASPSASNWLLARYPDVYLYAVAIEAAKHLRDADATAAIEPLLGQAMSSLKVDDERARWVNATVRVQGVTP